MNYSTGYYPDYETDTWIRRFKFTDTEEKKAEEIISYLRDEYLIAD